MQNNVEERTVDLQSAFRSTRVVNKTQFSKPVHEETDPRRSGSDHVGQRILNDRRNHGLGNSFLAKMCEQQKHAG